MQKHKSGQGFGIKLKTNTLVNKRVLDQEKKKREEEYEAKVYEDFVASFENASENPQFVKAGNDSSKPEVYKPKGNVLVFENQTKEEENENISQSESKKLKKRNLDVFLEEIKKGQEERVERLRYKKVTSTDGNEDFEERTKGFTLIAAFEEKPGSHELGDETTTNLYVGNLSPQTNEDMLLEEFGKFGAIGSVKIMWPRKKEEIERARNSGFVCFMDRECAAEALRVMDGFMLNGYDMRVCWGKAVPVPPNPIFDPGSDKILKVPLTGFPFNAKLPPKSRGGYGGTVLPLENVDTEVEIPEVLVTKPKDIKMLKLIHRTIENVIKHGPKFEELLMTKEVGNPQFQFLFEYEAPEHVYYRWKLYSLLNGDKPYIWKTDMFYMYAGGPIWIPPEPPARENEFSEMGDSSAEEESEKIMVSKSKLGEVATSRLKNRLKDLKLSNGPIAKAMVYAIEHAEASDQVAEIVSSFMFDVTIDQQVLLARLYLVSDILHNCSAPVQHAWKFRASFESVLPKMFKVIISVYNSIDTKIRSEHFKKNVLSVLAVWEAWLVYPNTFIEQLASGFFQKK